MYLVYQPEGQDEPTRWWYDPAKLMSVERETIEKLTGEDFSDFTKKAMNGNSLCRRALLFVFLKRQHPTLKFADVDYAWDELKLEFSKPELRDIREKLPTKFSGDELVEMQATFDQQIDEAPDSPEGSGKVRPPIVG